MAISDDQVRQILAGKSTQPSMPATETTETPATESTFDTGVDTQNQSPLSLVDRAKLSFADDAGREAFLRTKFSHIEKLPNGKFAVGNDPRALAPIDPEGMFNDVLGDMADIVSEIPVIAGQVGGAIAGSPAGPAGIIGGGALGSGMGEGFKKAIGKGLGVNQQDPMEVATDIAISTAFGGIGEGLGQAGKAVAGRVIAPKLQKMLDDVVLQHQVVGKDPGKFVKGLAKVINITAGVDEDATLTAGRYGFQNTLSAKNLDSKTVGEIANDLVAATHAKETELGNFVQKGAYALHKKTKGQNVVDVSTVYQDLVKELKSVGILESGNKVNQHSPSKGLGFFKKLLQELSGEDARIVKSNKIGRFGQVVGQKSNQQFVSPSNKISVKKALQIQRGFGGAIESLEGQDRAIAIKAITNVRQQMAELASRPNVRAIDFIEANKAFSGFQSLTEGLRSAGMNAKDPIQATNFLLGIGNTKNPTAVQAFQQLDNLLPTKVYDRAMMWNAAQKFKSSNVNLMRLAAVGGLLGAGFGGGDPGDRLTRAAIGIAVGSPAGLRTILKTGERIGRGAVTGSLKSAQKSINPGKIMQRVDSTTISQLARLVYQRRKNNG